MKKTKLLSHAVYTLVEMIPIVYLIALGFSKLSMYLFVYLSASSASISQCKNILLKKNPPSMGPLYIHAFFLLNLLLPMSCSRQFTDVISLQSKAMLCNMVTTAHRWLFKYQVIKYNLES